MENVYNARKKMREKIPFENFFTKGCEIHAGLILHADIEKELTIKLSA